MHAYRDPARSGDYVEMPQIQGQEGSAYVKAKEGNDREMTLEGRSRDVLLAKIPDYLYDGWAKQVKESGSRNALELGTLTMVKKPFAREAEVPTPLHAVRQYTIELREPVEAKSASSNVLEATYFKVNSRQEKKVDAKDRLPEFGNMLALAEREGVVAVEGTVAAKLEVRLDVSGMNDKQRKDLYGTKRKRGAQAAPDEETSIVRRIDRTPNAHRKPDKNKDKFVRMPKNDLLEKLFKLFEQQANWRFDDLRKNTQQPAEHLKEALSEIAVYLTKGSKELRNTWQLNSSFGGGEAAESEGGSGSGAAPVAEDDI